MHNLRGHKLNCAMAAVAAAGAGMMAHVQTGGPGTRAGPSLDWVRVSAGAAGCAQAAACRQIMPVPNLYSCLCFSNCCRHAKPFQYSILAAPPAAGTCGRRMQESDWLLLLCLLPHHYQACFVRPTSFSPWASPSHCRQPCSLHASKVIRTAR